jgi:hypothetical protein
MLRPQIEQPEVFRFETCSVKMRHVTGMQADAVQAMTLRERFSARTFQDRMHSRTRGDVKGGPAWLPARAAKARRRRGEPCAESGHAACAAKGREARPARQHTLWVIKCLALHLTKHAAWA